MQWFLGIQVHRDRTRRLLWLSQTAYIDKIITRAGTSTSRLPKVPMGRLSIQRGRKARVVTPHAFKKSLRSNLGTSSA